MSSPSCLDGKRILITGACGTVGSELIRQLSDKTLYAPLEIIGLDNNESALFFLDQEHLNDQRINFSIADIRDRNSMITKLHGVDVVFHTAALKHVIISERSPEQAVQTNILGVQNIIDAALSNHLEIVIFTSSDKAVNPTNVMGTSKLMGERLMTAANSVQHTGKTVFASTRFGNVLGSNGSVFPIFKTQIENGGPVTLTHADMTRFVMSVEESARLIINTAQIAKGGEVFVTKMPVVRISDLAEAMIQLYSDPQQSVGITEIGSKPGEKLYEELMSAEETRRSLELGDYFAILPAFRGIYNNINYNFENIEASHIAEPYLSSSQRKLDVNEIKALLKQYRLV